MWLCSLLAVVALVLTSCSSRMLDFTVISTKNVTFVANSKAQGKQVEGKSMGFCGFGSSIKEATDKALESAGPEYDILVDGVIYYRNYIFSVGYKVKGVAVSSQQFRAQLGDKGFQEWLSQHNVNLIDENGMTVVKQ